MSGDTATVAVAPALPTSATGTLPDNDLSLEFDPEQPELDDYFWRDETEHEARVREKEELSEVQRHQRLADPKRARGVYTDFIHASRLLTHAEFDVLYQLLKQGNPNLHNSFASRKTAAVELQMQLNTYDFHLGALKRKGVIRTHEFRKSDGTQAKGSGIQFCIPGHLFSSGKLWLGPCIWDNRRDGAVPKRPRKHRRAVSRPATNG